MGGLSYQSSWGDRHEMCARSSPTDRRSSEERRDPFRCSDSSCQPSGRDSSSRPTSGDPPRQRSRSPGRHSSREDWPPLRAPLLPRAQGGGQDVPPQRLQSEIVGGSRSPAIQVPTLLAGGKRSASFPTLPPWPPRGLALSRRGKFHPVVFRLVVVPLGPFRAFPVCVDLVSAFLSQPCPGRYAHASAQEVATPRCTEGSRTIPAGCPTAGSLVGI